MLDELYRILNGKHLKTPTTTKLRGSYYCHVLGFCFLRMKKKEQIVAVKLFNYDMCSSENIGPCLNHDSIL